MTSCIFESQSDGSCRCSRCHRTVSFGVPCEKIKAACNPTEKRQRSAAPLLTDTATRDGQEISVYLFSPPCQHMGAKRFFKDGSPKTAKETGCCGGGVVTFTPTYECAIFGKCAPFAAKIEDDFDRTQPCRGCEKHSQNNLESASASHSQ